jgi:hypothetical protein
MDTRRDVIKRARTALTRQSGEAQRNFDRPRLAEIETKRRLLAEAERAHSRRRKSVFISYTGRGRAYFDIARERFDQAGFEVRTGFDREVEVGRILPDEIMGRIRESSVFLGIWTHDFDASSLAGLDGRNRAVPAEAGGVPGVWMPFELGVAAALNKPFKILFQDTIHRLYIEKPFGMTPHIAFDHDAFKVKLESALHALSRWYEDVVARVNEQPSMRF